MRARHEIGVRWRALLSAALVCGLFGGVAIAVLAGARRATSADPAFMERRLAMDVIVLDASIYSPILWKPDDERLERLPYVTASARLVEGNFANGLAIVGGIDERYGAVVDRPVVLRGRLPRPDASDEIAVPHFADGELATFHVGDRKEVELGKRTAMLTVVGEFLGPGELPPQPFLGWKARVSPAFFARYRSDLANAEDALALRFKRRSDMRLFERDVQAMTGGRVLQAIRQDSHTTAVKGSTDLQVSALRILALFVAIGGVLILAQILARETALASTELPTLRALGMTRGQLFRLGVTRLVPVALLASVTALALGWLASPLLPRGALRVADPHSLLRPDGFVLSIGALAVAAATLTAALWPAWRVSRASAGDEETIRPSRPASAVASAGLPTPVVVGARLALEPGRGRASVPVVSSLAVVCLGVASFVAAATFGSSVRGLIDRPPLYGKTWNGVATTGDVPEDAPRVAQALAAEPDVEAVALADSGAPIRVFGEGRGHGPLEGSSTQAFTVQDVKGSLFPAVVEGRRPRGTGEIVLGARMIRSLGIHLDPRNPPTVRIGLEGGVATSPVHVVGRAVIPPLGDFGQIGYGVALADGRAIASLAGAENDQNFDLIIRWKAGADRKAVFKRLTRAFSTASFADDLSSGTLEDVVNFGGVRGAPIVIGGVLAGLGLAALGHVLVTAVRRRRRDIAILKTIGFLSGQVRATVAWQSSIIALVAAIVGLPLGVVGGRWLWRLVAEGLGVLPGQSTPGLALAAVPVCLLALANLIALIPARSAARTRPALALRSE